MGKMNKESETTTYSKIWESVPLPLSNIPQAADWNETKKLPIRCFDGDTKPHEPFWRIKDQVDGEEPEMELYGYISEYSWFDDDVTPGLFKQALMDLGQGGPITIRINSYGGDVVAASLIYAMIRDYPGKVTTQIDGIAASAATVVALAGDRVKMRSTGYFMIHDPSVVFFLAQMNIEDLTRLANSLQAVKEGIVNAYQDRTDLSRERISKLMTEETWMDAQRAFDLGFIDEILSFEEKKLLLPANTAVVNGLQNFAHVPQAVLDAMNDDHPAEVEASAPTMTEDMQREAQALRERVSSILERSTKNA